MPDSGYRMRATSRIMGNHAKEGIPWATLAGLWAVKLAAECFTVPLDILDHKGYYDASRIAAGLGESFVEKLTHLTRGPYPEFRPAEIIAAV